MALRPITIAFPAGGVDRRNSFQEQPPFTTPDSLNVWPFDADTGKRRLGTRAGTATFGTMSGTPRQWVSASYQKGTGGSALVQTGVALATSSTAYIYGYTTSSWTSMLTDGTGTSTKSVAIYLQTLIYASGRAATEFTYLPTHTADIGNLGDAVAGPLVLNITGTAPQRCTLAMSWGDRLVMSGDVQNPHIAYGCRIGNYRDWDDAQIDPASAFATGSAFGLIHPPVSALIPVSQHIAILGGTESMHVLRGNPSGGGSHGMLDANVGPIRNNSWCRIKNSILFMSRAGLYRTNGSDVEPVSQNKIPSELMGLGENDLDEVSLAYDTRWNGVHIVGKRDPGTDAPFAFFLDMDKGGFWPMDFGTFNPTMAMSKPDIASSESSNVILLEPSISRSYDRTVVDQDDCHIIYGPVPMNGQFGEGVIEEMTATLGKDSADVHWCIYVGNSPEEAMDKVQTDLDVGSSDITNADYVGTDWAVSGSRTYQLVQRPVQRGNCFYLKIWGDTVGGTVSSHIAVEEIIGKVSASPERRTR